MKALMFHKNMARIAATKVLSQVSDDAPMGRLAPVRLEEIPEPVIRGDKWVVFDSTLTGICGSDTKQVLLKGAFDNPLTALISFPHVLGHEATGVISQVGPGVEGLKVGDRVALNPWLSCAPRGIDPVCSACEMGNLALCENFDQGELSPALHLGNCADLPGAYAPKVAAHESQLFKIPDTVSDEQAVLADPFAVSFHAVLKDPPPEKNATVLIYGAGIIGLAAVAVVKALRPDARILVIGRYPHQVRAAERLGAETVLTSREPKDIIDEISVLTSARTLKPWYGLPMLNGGVDVIYDTICTPETFEIGVRILRSRGTLSVIGVEAPARFEWTPIYFKELRIAGSNAFGIEEFRGERKHAIDHYLALCESGEIDMGDLITHRHAMSDWKEAFGTALQKGPKEAVKVVIDHRLHGKKGSAQ